MLQKPNKFWPDGPLGSYADFTWVFMKLMQCQIIVHHSVIVLVSNYRYFYKLSLLHFNYLDSKKASQLEQLKNNEIKTLSSENGMLQFILLTTNTPYSKMAAIVVFFCFLANYPLLPRLRGNILLNFEFKNVATRVNLQENQRIKWRPFWNKVYSDKIFGFAFLA